jgi:hypothetical protein
VFPPPPGPATSKGPLAVVFGVLALILLLAGGAAGALYFAETNRSDDLREDLEAVERDLADVQEELDGIRADAADCSEAVGQLFGPGADQITEEEFNTIVITMIGTCDISLAQE